MLSAILRAYIGESRLDDGSTYLCMPKIANFFLCLNTYDVTIRSNRLCETIRTNGHTIGLMMK